MTRTLVIKHRRLALTATVLLAGMVWHAPAPAQSPDSGLTLAERLEMLDETYSSNLRKYHAPVLAEYLVLLEKLKQTPAVRAEIERVRKAGATTGLLPYDALKPAPSKDQPGRTPDPRPATGMLPKKNGIGDNIILTAATALKSSPDSAGLAEKPAGGALPLGSATWRIAKISAGEYRVTILYSCAGKPEGPVIQARLGGKSVHQAFGAAHATGGINEFRIARLGLLSVAADLAGENFELQASDPGPAALWVRQVILTRAGENEAGVK